MATLQQQLKKAENLNPEKVTKALFDFIRKIEKKVVDLNKQQLNRDSIDVDGQPIGFYSYATEVISNGRKRQGEPFDAKDTGDFLKGFYITIRGDNIFFSSKDGKTKDILQSEHWLSHDIFGLTDNNLRELIQRDLLPFVLQLYRKELGI